MKYLWHKRKPCEKCPYKLGQIRTPINPCPQCKLNDYQSYELFEKQLLRRKQKIIQ